MRNAFSISLVLLFGGCAIGPDYIKPDTAVPERFRNGTLTAPAPIDTAWWEAFNDPRLSDAVRSALSANHDLRSAQAGVEAMLGKFVQAEATLYPQINANGSLTRKGVNDSTPRQYMLREGVTSTYAASLSLASYEIDLFGKVRRANEAARALLLSSEYAKETVKLSVASNAAASYVRLSSLQSQIDLAEENVAISRDLLAMTELKYKHGIIAQMPLLQAQSELENAQAALSALQASKISEEAAFNLLLGRNPSPSTTTPLSSIVLPDVPAAIPSLILTRRPDIANAEQNLIAANAQIGIARGQYFPSIKLTGMLGVQSLELSDFVSNPAKLWEIAPAVSIPLFTAGRIEGEIKTAEAEREKTLLAYQKAIVGAFNDADNALSQRVRASEQSLHHARRADAIQIGYEQARLRYQTGTISYADMLVVQQQWLQTRQNLLITRQNTLIATINLYKALGGGWSEPSGGTTLPLSLSKR